jgi:hypothetical protein
MVYGQGPVGVQTGELKRLADEMRASGTVLDQAASKVGQNLFGYGNSEAGRNYWQEGLAIHKGLEGIADWLKNWSTAIMTTGDALGAAVVVYSDTDVENAKIIANSGTPESRV